MNSRFTMAVHLLGMLTWAQRSGMGPLTSERAAESINTSPVVIRRLVAMLHAQGMVEARKGPNGGIQLAREPEKITLREVYEAVSEDAPVLGGYTAKPGAKCPVAPYVAEYLEGLRNRAEEAMKAQLDMVTIQQMTSEIIARVRKSGKCKEHIS